MALAVPLTLALVVLMSYTLKQIQGAAIATVPWTDLLGVHVSRWLRPVLRGSLYEEGLPPEFQRNYFAWLLVGCATLAFAFKSAGEFLVEDLGEKVALDLRVSLARGLTQLPYPSAAAIAPGALALAMGDLARESRVAFGRLFGALVQEGMMAFVLLVWLVLLDTQLFVLFALVGLPAGIVIRVSGKVLKRLARQGMSLQSDAYDMLLERMRGWETIQVHRAIRHELQRFERTSESLFHNWRRSARARALASPLVEWLALAAAAAVLTVALRRVADGALASSTLTAFLVTVAALGNSLQQVSAILNQARNGIESVRRTRETISGAPFSEPQAAQASPLLSFPCDRIDARDLTLATRDGRTLCTKLSLSMEAGDFVVLRGPSGAGKSTLLRALLGLEEAQAGSVEWNGAALRDAHAQRPWDVTYLGQDPFVFDASVLENVCYPHSAGESPSTLARARAALDAAELELSPQRRAIGLSGGERQRLMIARAWYHRSSLLVIDEGTSAMDLELESVILERLRTHWQARMVLMVAHRDACAAFATKVVQL